MLDYDGGRLAARIAGFDAWRALAFSAACVEFLIPAYRRFAELEDVGDPDAVEAALDQVWARLLAPGPEGPERSSGLPAADTVLDLLPAEEDWNEWSACAENAVGALALLMDLADSGRPDLAVRIAQQAYEAVDAIASAELDPPFMTPAAAREILGSDVVQSELRRQSESIDVLAAVDGRPAEIEAAATLRDAARVLALGRPDPLS